MYIYRGKLNFSPSDSQNATNEAITIMFPSKFLLGDPVYTCWQWSALGRSKNVPCWITSTIDSVSDSDTDGNKIGFYGCSDYRFDTHETSDIIISELITDTTGSMGSYQAQKESRNFCSWFDLGM